jgi:hypothetical protein
VPAGERAVYTLVAQINYGAHTVSVAQGIQYPNQTGEALSDLVLAVEPNLWPGCFMLQSVKADRQIAGFDLNRQKLTVTFTEPLPAGEAVYITFGYSLDLPHSAWGNDEIIRNLIFGYTDKQMNLLDWYPFIVPYVPGEGWLLHEPGNYGEHLVYDLADFDVILLFPYGQVVPQVAAPAEGKWFGTGYTYKLEAARNFALSLSPDFRMVRVATSGVMVQSYYFEDDVAGGQAALDAAAQAVALYSDLFAPYPHPVLTIVQGDFIPSMEYDGLVYVGHTFYHETRSLPRSYLVVLTAHEVAHQWWFALVGNDQAMEPWLDESLATYSEYVFFEQVYPEELDWWQESRLDQYLPLSGWVDRSIYDLNSSYSEAVYLRGAEFLGGLRLRIGDEVFFDTLHYYSLIYSGRRATADDFFRILYATTHVDISDIIGTYFNGPH